MLKVISGSSVSEEEGLMKKAYEFRHSIFVAEKQWEELRSADGLERDRFDDANAIHQVCMRDGKIAGYQRLLPTTRPHLLTDVLADMCAISPPRGADTYEWSRFCVASKFREPRPRGNGVFLELVQGVVEWGIASGIKNVSVVIDWRLMIVAMQLRFFVQPLGFPKKIGRDEVVALKMAFDHNTLDAIHRARGSTASVLPPNLPIASVA